MLQQPQDPSASSHLAPTRCPIREAHRCAGDHDQTAPALSPQSHAGDENNKRRKFMPGIESLRALGQDLFSEGNI